jgi:hypothetical protein
VSIFSSLGKRQKKGILPMEAKEGEIALAGLGITHLWLLMLRGRIVQIFGRKGASL